MYQRNISKAGNVVLAANVEVTIATADGIGSKSLAVGQFGCNVTSVYLTGATSTDTKIKFYNGANLVKTLTSSLTGAGVGEPGINNTDVVVMEKNGINKITVVSTAAKASGVNYAIGIEAN